MDKKLIYCFKFSQNSSLLLKNLHCISAFYLILSFKILIELRLLIYCWLGRIYAIEEKSKKERKLSNELKEWINWANQKAGWYNPLIDQEDPLLGPYRPELIEEKKRSSIYYNGYL